MTDSPSTVKSSRLPSGLQHPVCGAQGDVRTPRTPPRGGRCPFPLRLPHLAAPFDRGPLLTRPHLSFPHSARENDVKGINCPKPAPIQPL